MKNKSRILLLIPFAAALLASGCMTMQKSHSQNMNIRVVNGEAMRLPTPAQLHINLHATQILNAKYKQKSLTAQVQVEINNKKLVLVALGSWGGQVFSIDYNGSSIKSSHLKMPNAALGTNSILRDFLLTYVPTKELKRQLIFSHITLTASNKKRVFSVNGKPIIQINYTYKNPWKGTIVLHNFVQRYTIKIKTISYTKQPSAQQ